MIDFIYDEFISGEGEPQALPAVPDISATNPDEPGRMRRVISTWGAACSAVALMSNRYQRLWDGAVAAIHDHKGTLEITWRDHESRVMFEGVMVGAWQRHGEHASEHKLA